MCVILGRNNFAVFHLLADHSVSHPRLFHNLIHNCPGFGVEIKHSVNNVATFPRQQSKNPPRTSNDFLAFPGATLTLRLVIARLCRGSRIRTIFPVLFVVMMGVLGVVAVVVLLFDLAFGKKISWHGAGKIACRF